MTRKHFVAMAKILREAKPSEYHGPAAYRVWSRIVRRIASEFSASNTGFNIDRFFAACKLDGN